jgi:anti-anti-sigma factor
MSSFEIDIRDDGDPFAVTLALSGELDIASADQLDAQLDAQLAARDGLQELVLDLEQLEFLDSSGLRAILRADAKVRDAGLRMRLVPGPEAVQRVFEVTGAGDRLDFGAVSRRDR